MNAAGHSRRQREHLVSRSQIRPFFEVCAIPTRPIIHRTPEPCFAGTAMKIFRTAVLASLLLNHLPAHATSFDCTRGRSVPEQLICHRADLSGLDDQLGKLYWQARRAVANPKAFRADSDSKWAWREANCADEACLKTWYAGRIEELQRLLASLRQGPAAEPSKPAESVEPDPAPRLHELSRDPERRGLAHVQPDAMPMQAEQRLRCNAPPPIRASPCMTSVRRSLSRTRAGNIRPIAATGSAGWRTWRNRWPNQNQNRLRNSKRRRRATCRTPSPRDTPAPPLRHARADPPRGFHRPGRRRRSCRERSPAHPARPAGGPARRAHHQAAAHRP